MILYDCHAHVYEQITPVTGARYVPNAPAPLAHWINHLDEHGLKGGVIVQVSFLGFNNSELCNALQQLDRNHFAGVAVVPLSVTNEELDRLSSIGVRGFRWNLVRGAQLPDLQNPEVGSFLERIYARGMHLELHLESPHLANFITPLLSLGGTVVVDHLGLPADADPAKDPWLQSIRKNNIDLSALYVKLSGAYRTPFDTHPHAMALMEALLPDRIIWGSDWPHTQHEMEVNFHSIANDRFHLPVSSDLKAVQSLYGLKPS